MEKKDEMQVGGVAVSPEHASLERALKHEPEPIPEGKRYSVAAFNADSQRLAEPKFEAMTHEDAVAACVKANQEAEALGNLVWYGVMPADEAAAS